MPNTKNCVVVGCNSSSENKDGTFGFHAFPEDEALRQQWILATNKSAGWTPGKNSLICSKHFQSNDFSKKAEKRFRLNKNVIPCNVGATSSSDSAISGEPFGLVKRPRVEEATCEISQVESSLNDTVHDNVSNVTEEPHIEGNISQGVQTEFAVKNKGCQVNLKRKGCHVTTQTLKYGGLMLKSKACQTFIIKTTSDVATQTNFAPTHQSTPLESEVDSAESQPNPNFDADYIPSEMNQDSLNDVEFSTESHPANERKFIVFESCLLQLFKLCFICLSPCSLFVRVKGTLVRVTATCIRSDCGHVFNWTNEDSSNKRILGNILLSAAILFTGSCSTKILRLLSFVGIQAFSPSTYFRIQKAYLFPAVERVWKTEQEKMFRDLLGQPLIIAADGRSDSPGFSAKYGSYSFQDTKHNKIIHFELVQSNEVGGSGYMEKEDLIPGLKFLKEKNLNVTILVTDRHRSIRAYLRDHRSDIKHYFDTWHVAKGFGNQLKELGKRKKYAILREWTASINNHIYWLVKQSKGDLKLMEAIWMSMLNHVADKHSGHEEPFNACLHEERPRKWLVQDSPAYVELEKKARKLLPDIRQLSPYEQTSSIEVYHSVVNHFAPKSTHFSHRGMNSRLVLAVMHYNENSQKPQAVTKSGNLRWQVVYPKAKGGEHSLKAIKVASTFEYVETLMKAVFSEMETVSSYHGAASRENYAKFPTLAASCTRVSKEEAVNNFRSRYGNREDEMLDLSKEN